MVAALPLIFADGILGLYFQGPGVRAFFELMYLGQAKWLTGNDSSSSLLDL